MKKKTPETNTFTNNYYLNFVRGDEIYGKIESLNKENMVR